MKTLTLDQLIDSVPPKDSILITIDNDLSEKIYHADVDGFTQENLKKIIQKTSGYCHLKGKNTYSVWIYDNKEKTYQWIDGLKEEDYFIHDKLKKDLNLEKISGKKYIVEVPKNE